MKYRIFIEQDEDGIFVAECPSLPGCISQGKTRKDAIENIKDAISGYLDSLKKHNEPIPPSIRGCLTIRHPGQARSPAEKVFQPESLNRGASSEGG